MFRRMLIPVDGTRSSGSVVPHAAELARRLGCQVDLLLVQPERGARLPHPEHHMAGKGNGESGRLSVGGSSGGEIEDANQRYVARHVEELAAQGVEAKGHLRSGTPVEEILRAALDLRCDMIAMATRYRGQFARPAKGSVAEEVVWRSRLPMLLVAEG